MKILVSADRAIRNTQRTYEDPVIFSEYLLPLNFRQTNYEYEIELYVLDKNT